MPAISSDTLFHFTNKDNLLGILENEFYPRFSLEQYHVDDTVPPFKVGIPMICFCDIPLSMTYAHMAKYGNYGIGMSKEWAKNNRLNPVLYLHKGSQTTKLFDNALNSIHEDVNGVRKQGIEIHSLTGLRDMLFKVFTYTKSFDGDINIEGKIEYQKSMNSLGAVSVPLSTFKVAWLTEGKMDFDELIINPKAKESEHLVLTKKEFLNHIQH